MFIAALFIITLTRKPHMPVHRYIEKYLGKRHPREAVP
jgi:hypothetical protein